MKPKMIRYELVIVMVVAAALSGLLAGPTSAYGPPISPLPPATRSVVPISPGHSEDRDSAPPPEDRGELYPGTGGENKPVKDPETPGYSVVFPVGAVPVPVRVRALNSETPEGVPEHSGVGSPFFLGVWRMREGETVHDFAVPIRVNAEYDDRELSPAEEEQLRIYMYNPSIQAWIKLGGDVDIYDDVVSGLASTLPPFEDSNTNTLFKVDMDTSPELDQQVDEAGNTTLSSGGFQLTVPPGTVELGTHFEATALPHIVTDNGDTIVNALDINAYFIDHSQASNQAWATSDMARSITIELQTNSGDCGSGKPTVVTLRDGQWAEMNTTQHNGTVSVVTDELGTFGVTCQDGQ